MLSESDVQVPLATGGKPATHAIIPVGCGGIAQAVTQHYKSSTTLRDQAPAAVIAVEPSTAACLNASLSNLAHKTGSSVTIDNVADSIMCGMNCGTLSTTAWPILRNGVDASVVVSDLDAHNAVQQFLQHGVAAGPCGASTLAALEAVCSSAAERERLSLDESAVVVLFCTEGARGYAVPTE